MLLGDFDYGALEDGHFLVGPLLFVSFMALASIILMVHFYDNLITSIPQNILIAIISDNYMELRAHQQEVWERVITKELINDLLKRQTRRALLSIFNRLFFRKDTRSPSYTFTQDIPLLELGSVSVFETEYLFLL